MISHDRSSDFQLVSLENLRLFKSTIVNNKFWVSVWTIAVSALALAVCLYLSNIQVVSTKIFSRSVDLSLFEDLFLNEWKLKAAKQEVPRGVAGTAADELIDRVKFIRQRKDYFTVRCDSRDAEACQELVSSMVKAMPQFVLDHRLTRTSVYYGKLDEVRIEAERQRAEAEQKLGGPRRAEALFEQNKNRSLIETIAFYRADTIVNLITSIDPYSEEQPNLLFVTTNFDESFNSKTAQLIRDLDPQTVLLQQWYFGRHLNERSIRHQQEMLSNFNNEFREARAMQVEPLLPPWKIILITLGIALFALWAVGTAFVIRNEQTAAS